jgi:ELWxxDGT repeat protein
VGSGPRDLRVVNGIAYFVAGDPEAGTELWKTDGTETGTVRVADIATGARSSDPDELTLAGERLYFTAFTARTGRELWALDSANICTTGCTALQGQTFRVRDPEPGARAGSASWWWPRSPGTSNRSSATRP